MFAMSISDNQKNMYHYRQALVRGYSSRKNISNAQIFTYEADLWTVCKFCVQQKRGKDKK